jgi:hypothetical protein
MDIKTITSGNSINQDNITQLIESIGEFFTNNTKALVQNYKTKKVEEYNKYLEILKSYIEHVNNLIDFDSIQYSDTDPRWLYAVYVALSKFFVARSLYYKKALPNKTYQYILHNTFTIFGDAGTNDKYLTNTIDGMLNCNSKQFIHLGDIYYAGSKSECQDFIKYTTKLHTDVNELWCLSGNHEYISAGQGFFEDVLPHCGSKSTPQEASFFSLVNDENKVLLIALDTGYKCTNFTMPPASEQMDITTYLDKAQNQWLEKTLNNYVDYRVILLSHHPLASDKWPDHYFNHLLMQQIAAKNRNIILSIAGHDHRCVIYPYQYGPIEKVLTIGHASMPIIQNDYHTNCAFCPIEKDFIPSFKDNYGNNGFINILLDKDNIKINFYQVDRTTGITTEYNTLFI